MPYKDPALTKRASHAAYLRHKEKIKRRKRILRAWAKAQGYGTWKGYGKGQKWKKWNRKIPPMRWLVCKRCGEEFFIPKRIWRRQRQKFCSRYCSTKATPPKRKLKRHPVWTNEQWEWERKLSAAGLGKYVGEVPNGRRLTDSDGA